MAGWTAHILEQLANNRLIRPQATYTGPAVVPYVPVEQRGKPSVKGAPPNGAPAGA
jgi:citrate synthase